MRRSHHREIRSSAKVTAVGTYNRAQGYKDVGPGERCASLLKAGIESCVGETMSRMKINRSMYRRVGSLAWLSETGSVVSMGSIGKLA